MSRSWRRLVSIGVLAVAGVVAPVGAGSPLGSASSSSGAASGQQAREGDEGDWAGEGETSIVTESGRTFVLFPRTHLFGPYLADPHRVGFGFTWMHFDEASIAESSAVRIGLRVGARLGLLRVHPKGREDRGWQLHLEVGLDGQYDRHHNLDNVGWDGNYGLLFTRAGEHGLALKLGVLHTSSHVGDEYAERTGRMRLNYTREEVLAALSWQASPRWRTYAEGAWAYTLRNEEVQEPARAQIGLEYERARSLWKERLGWYAAVDFSAMEERDWRLDGTLQIGFVHYAGTNGWRLGVEYHDGRVPMGEFYQDTESYLGLGLWLDM